MKWKQTKPLDPITHLQKIQKTDERVKWLPGVTIHKNPDQGELCGTSDLVFLSILKGREKELVFFSILKGREKEEHLVGQ